MEKGSIKILGEGFVSSGEYESIKIVGSAKSKGNIKSDEVKVLGDAKFEGDINIKNFVVNGKAVIRGNLKAERVRVNGQLNIDGDAEIDDLVITAQQKVDGKLKCNNVTIRGQLSVNENMYAQNIKIYGEMRNKSNIECEDIKVYGVIECDGLLNGENIYVYSGGGSYCKEIGATNIKIGRSKDVFSLVKIINIFSGKFKCDLIEGDTIELEDASIKDIRGKSVSLVDNCDVGNIEYSDNLSISDNSTVKNSIKVG
ncbi:polymer-forming cytoskeletal protein [Clostridioides sp. ZZV14-6345]|uniref:polymer-forming cytoskeletal protein n=1 Tax=Clostridioides sp. ZZV14-6345 TaxID=2811496 RepID=UPI001D10D092|nr:polymer-forming cytoskeletal protein [Clostridioides sp. ZZV14-6345]